MFLSNTTSNVVGCTFRTKVADASTNNTDEMVLQNGQPEVTTLPRLSWFQHLS
jgi:hypothetical protein